MYYNLLVTCVSYFWNCFSHSVTPFDIPILSYVLFSQHPVPPTQKIIKYTLTIHIQAKWVGQVSSSNSLIKCHIMSSLPSHSAAWCCNYYTWHGRNAIT